VKPLVAFLIALPVLAAQPFTIDQVLSAPFPENLTASPKGDAVAWVQDAAGVRNIWIARAPDYKAVQFTNFTEDDGHEIPDLVWKPDGTGLDSKPEQLIHARGKTSDLRWSPDRTLLAFVSQRGDHALIGIYDVATKSVRFADPSVDMDQSPVWAPDSRQIAFIRVPTPGAEFEYGPKRTGPPWSIRVADAKTGQGREVWKAKEGRGSVFWPAPGTKNQLLWMSGDRLAFPWERDGWLHLYTILMNGGEAKLLTPGDFEIQDLAPTPDRIGFVLSSNQGDPDRRHIWRVSQQLTKGDGIEWSPVPLADGRIAFLHSGSKMPARPAILEPDGSIRNLTPIPADFPTASLVDPQPVILTAKDGLKFHGQLFLPPDDATAKHPAVVFFHGGSRRQMLLGWHSMQYYNQAYGFNQYLASKGYVVLSINYRSGIGYGSDFREAPAFGATGASEFNDVLAAGSFLRARSDVDPARIGAWGGSYGGYLTALALARASDIFKVGVDLHGVHDWNLEVTTVAPARDREKRQAIERLAFESSPMASIKTWRSPVLLIQGDDDHTVAFAQTVQLIAALRKQGVPFEQLIFPDEDHDFKVHADWLKAYHAADTFLARYLNPK
jgi:dipeptidyl aminopeptidase/acylaminoacyl peptidase